MDANVAREANTAEASAFTGAKFSTSFRQTRIWWRSTISGVTINWGAHPPRTSTTIWLTSNSEMPRPSETKAGLRDAGRMVVVEYRSRKWPELYASGWPEAREFLLVELLTRCPGFSTREYRIALNAPFLIRGPGAPGRAPIRPRRITRAIRKRTHKRAAAKRPQNSKTKR